MQITREVAVRLLGVDAKKFANFVKEGRLDVVKRGWGGRKFYDRNQVLELAKELGKVKEL